MSLINPDGCDHLDFFMVNRKGSNVYICPILAMPLFKTSVSIFSSRFRGHVRRVYASLIRRDKIYLRRFPLSRE